MKKMVPFRAGDKVELWHCVGRLPAYWFKSQSEARHHNGQDSERTMTNAPLRMQYYADDDYKCGNSYDRKLIDMPGALLLNMPSLQQIYTSGQRQGVVQKYVQFEAVHWAHRELFKRCLVVKFDHSPHHQYVVRPEDMKCLKQPLDTQH